MKLSTYFRQAIQSGDWEQVCKVFTKITGEHVDPPVITPAFADMDMEEDEPTSPADLEMEDDEEGDEEDEEAPVEKVEAQTPPLPQSTRRATVEDFKVERTDAATENDGGKRLARKMPMNRKGKKNRFIDNQKVAMKDSVLANPLLGVQNPVPRGQRDLIEGASDTSIKVDVICSLCGKQESVSQALAVGWVKEKAGTPIEDSNNTYKCNHCQTPLGRTELLRRDRNN